MMTDPSLSALANELSVAVEITMNPQASPQQRMDAYIACEKLVLQSNDHDFISLIIMFTFQI